MEDYSPQHRRTPTKVRAHRSRVDIDEIPTRDVSNYRKRRSNSRCRSCNNLHIDHFHRSTDRKVCSNAHELCRKKSPDRSKFRKSFPECSRPEHKVSHKRCHSEERRCCCSNCLNGLGPRSRERTAAKRYVKSFQSRNNSAAFSDSSEESEITGNPSLSKKINKMWKNGQLCDIVLHAGGKHFFAHRLVMAASCEYFVKHFICQKSVSDYNVPKIRASVMADVLNYCYTGKIEVHDDNIYELVSVSLHLCIKHLLKLCVEFLSNVTISSVKRNLQIAQSFRLMEVVRKINLFIKGHFDEFVSSQTFLENDFRIIYDTMSLRLLATSELMLFNACAKWIEFDRALRTKYVIPLMSLVRFADIPTEDLTTQVETIDFMSKIPECKEMLYRAYREKALAQRITLPKPEELRRHRAVVEKLPDNIWPPNYSTTSNSETSKIKAPPPVPKKPLLVKEEQAATEDNTASGWYESAVETSTEVAEQSNATKECKVDDEEKNKIVPKQETTGLADNTVKHVVESVLNAKSSLSKTDMPLKTLPDKTSVVNLSSTKISKDDLVKKFPKVDDKPRKLSAEILKIAQSSQYLRRLSKMEVRNEEVESTTAKFNDVTMSKTYPERKQSHISAIGASKIQLSPRSSKLQLSPRTSNAKIPPSAYSYTNGFVASSKSNNLGERKSSNLNLKHSHQWKGDCVEDSEVPGPSHQHSQLPLPSSETVFDGKIKASASDKHIEDNETIHRSRSQNIVSASSTRPADSERIIDRDKTLKGAGSKMSVKSHTQITATKNENITSNSFCNVNDVRQEEILDLPENEQGTNMRERQVSLSSIPAQVHKTVSSFSPPPGVILVMGGINPYHDNHTTTYESNSIQQFDPALNSWSIRSHLPTAIHHFAVTAMRGKIYVIGGQMSHSEDVSPLKECHYYDVRKDKWHTIAGLKAARSHHVAVCLKGNIYTLGGVDCVQMSLKSMEVYNSDQDKWEYFPAMADARSGLAAITHRGRILVVGGMLDIDEKFLLDSVEVYNPNNKKWSFRFPLPISICETSLAEVHGVIYMVGGYVMKDKEPLSLDSVFRYCDETDTWEGFDTMHVPRHKAVVTVLDNRIYIIGGESSAAMGHALSNVECIDVKHENHVTGIAPLLAPAYGIAGCVVDPNEK